MIYKNKNQGHSQSEDTLSHFLYTLHFARNKKDELTFDQNVTRRLFWEKLSPVVRI